MFSIILLLSFILLFLIFYKINLKSGPLTNFRLSFVESFIIFTLLSLIFVEFLSFFKVFTFLGLLLCWFILFSVLCYIVFFKIRQNLLDSLKNIKINLSRNYKILILLLCIFILFPLLFLAVYYPPNNWDSMTYHLSRVMHWIQNKNVNFYPTSYVNQLTNNPLGEYIITNIYLMAGGDYFVNLIQFMSMLCSVFLSSLF